MVRIPQKKNIFDQVSLHGSFCCCVALATNSHSFPALAIAQKTYFLHCKKLAFPAETKPFEKWPKKVKIEYSEPGPYDFPAKDFKIIPAVLSF